MTDDKPPEPSETPGVTPPRNKTVKLRCPYCGYTFEPHTGSACPQCKHVMTIPSTFRSGPRQHKKLSASERRRLSGGASGPGLGTRVNDLLRTRQKSRIVIWLIFAFLLLGYFLIRQASRFTPATFSSPGRQSPGDRTVEDLQNLQVALELFKEHCGRYPTTEEGLKALERQPGYRQWRGPYIIRLVPDAWKTPYFYMYSNQTYTLFSAGPDALAGTPDDLSPVPYDVTNMPPAQPTTAPDSNEPPIVTIGP